eukprot:TRINITY_DN30559_c0_g1_i1.p1 TRINITY_DN30559_c0_g1~~TRINITY_DN30559_c0_g1_i1.p1  ORF type:complete len:350 (-),score=80.97 TRINITY_DN30559_c0_g1_i1:11-1060(-)
MDHVKDTVTPTGDTWDGMLVTFLSELGDKTFFATVSLAIWCPFYGLRYYADDHMWQMLGVFGGALCGMNLRLLLVRLRLSKPTLGLPYLDCFLSMLLLFFLLYVGKFLLEDLNDAEEKERRALREQERLQLQRDSSSSQGGPPPPSGNPFLGEFRAYQPPGGDKPPEQQGYGSALGNSAGDGSAIADERWSPALMAFVSAAAIVFILESNDKSYILMQTTLADAGGYIMYGVILGLSLSMAIAVLVGYIVDISMSESRKLFLICCAIVALCFAMLSDAVLFILHNTYKPGLTPTATHPAGEVTKALPPRPSEASASLLEMVPESSLRVGRRFISRFLSQGHQDTALVPN